MRQFALALMLSSCIVLTHAVTAAAGQLEDGLAAYDNGDYTAAIQNLLPLAQAGNADALLTVGNMYTKGQGVIYDYAKAIEFFGKAYAAGSYDSLAEMGNMYRGGMGVDQSYAKAVAMFQEAAHHGSLSGESYLGEAYASGQGVPVDYQKALTLFEDAANRGHIAALVNIGNLYLAGRGVPKDIPTAVKYYTAAIDKNSPQAMNNLGLLWQKGKGVTQDQAGALKLFEKSGMLGESSGAYNAGWVYENGIGTEQDLVQAYKWYDIGANEGGTFSARRRDLLSTQLTADQIQQAKQEERSYNPQAAPTTGQQASSLPQQLAPQDLRAWIGHLPWDTIRGAALFNSDQLNSRLSAIFGEEAVKKIGEMWVSVPIREDSGWIVVWVCKPHACNTNHFSLGVNMETQEIIGCIRFDKPDWQSQEVISGGTNFDRRQWVIAAGTHDQCAIDRLGIAQIEAALAEFPSAPEISSSSTTSPSSQAAAVAQPSPPATESSGVSSGTGYVIDDQGDVVTAYHVVKGCKTLAVRHGGLAASAVLVASDELNDLAVINGSLLGMQPVKFRDGKGIRPADAVVAIGYPYAGLLSTTPEITTGTVTALAGIGDDSRFLQITAPIQPGNSGGPLFDTSGNVVGTVVSTLDPIIMAKLTGSVPQNVNFGSKSGVVREFLDSKGIAYQTALSTAKLDPADVGEAGSRSVVMVECAK